MHCYFLLTILVIVVSTVSSFHALTVAAVKSKNNNILGRHQHQHQLLHDITSHTTQLQASVSPPIVAMPVVVHSADVIRTSIGIILARKISNSGYKKKSLNKSGALSAFLVASLSLATSWRNGLTLLTFYWTSSKLTRVGTKIKGKLEEGVTEGGERDASQVLACSLIAIICACLRRILVGRDGPLLSVGGVAILEDTAISQSLALFGDQLTLAYVGFFGCCAGDTWASELGILSKSLPRLITKPWKKVPPGTNGGISLVGLLASAAGGMVMGMTHGLFMPGGIASILPFMTTSISTTQFVRELLVLTCVGFVGGFGGSLLDSLLGATIQATYYDTETKKIAKRPGPATKTISGWGFLSNEMVNVVSSLLSAVAAALLTKSILNWI